MEEIGQAYGISFVVEEAALSDAGISLDQPVTLKAEQISLKTVMGLLLKDSRLTFAVKDQSVQITTTPKLVTTSYLVADLVTPSEGAKGKARPTQEKKLIDLIMCCVAARSWDVMGGPGTIDYHPLTMSLTVNQTPDVQEQIADLLTEAPPTPRHGSVPRCAHPDAPGQKLRSNRFGRQQDQSRIHRFVWQPRSKMAIK